MKSRGQVLAKFLRQDSSVQNYNLPAGERANSRDSHRQHPEDDQHAEHETGDRDE
jgi:hypothetical protein